jgi:hypothetical protein
VILAGPAVRLCHSGTSAGDGRRWLIGPDPRPKGSQRRRLIASGSRGGSRYCGITINAA